MGREHRRRPLAPCVVTIGGIDPTGGAGITADARHLRAHGVRAGAVATAIVTQDLRRVRKVVEIDPALVVEQLRSSMKVLSPRVLLVSLLPSELSAAAVAGELARWTGRHQSAVVYDPVLRATVGDRLSATPGPWLRQVLGATDVFCPNFEEAAEVAKALRLRVGVSRSSAGRLAAALAARLRKGGPKAVVLKSARPGWDLVASGSRSGRWVGALPLPGPPLRLPLRGTGSAHASAIAAELAKGSSVPRAAAAAKWYVESMLSASEDGRRRGTSLRMPAEPLWRPRASLLTAVEEAAKMLEASLDHATLPEVGTNVAYAMPFASSLEEVASLDSRIVRHASAVRSHGSPAFGVDSHMARMSLAASNVDPGVRSSCNLRYTAALVAGARRAGLGVVELDRRLEGEGETMRWLVERAARGRKRLPDVIFDRGAPGKEAMARFLGPDPVSVARNVERALVKMRSARAGRDPRRRNS